MISTVLAVAVDVAVPIYLIGTLWMAYRAVCVAPAWLREHPRSLGRTARRTLIVAGLVPLWPPALLALGWLLWRQRHRCPFGECSLWGWHTPARRRAPRSASTDAHTARPNQPRPPEPRARRSATARAAAQKNDRTQARPRPTGTSPP